MSVPPEVISVARMGRPVAHEAISLIRIRKWALHEMFFLTRIYRSVSPEVISLVRIRRPAIRTLIFLSSF